MQYQIEIIGMKKNRDLKIVITIIILAILGILVSVGVILYNKYNMAMETALESGNFATEEMALSEGENEVLEDIENSDSEGTQTEDSIATKSEEEIQEFINNINNIYNGEEGKRVFLTFDDGPTEEVTPYILDILDKYNIKATFFVLGTSVKKNPDILIREYESGHYIANHGYSHKYSNIYKSADTVLEEYNKTEEAIREALGIKNYSSHLFRFPGGSRGGPYEEIKEEAREKLEENGVAYLDWSALTYDAEGAKTKDEILSNLKSTMKGWNNVVILMHDSADKQITYESLEDVIKYLQEEGFEFKDIYDLM